MKWTRRQREEREAPKLDSFLDCVALCLAKNNDLLRTNPDAAMSQPEVDFWTSYLLDLSGGSAITTDTMRDAATGPMDEGQIALASEVGAYVTEAWDRRDPTSLHGRLGIQHPAARIKHPDANVRVFYLHSWVRFGALLAPSVHFWMMYGSTSRSEQEAQVESAIEAGNMAARLWAYCQAYYESVPSAYRGETNRR